MWTIWLRSVELIACVFQALSLTVCSSLVLHNVNYLAEICWVDCVCVSSVKPYSLFFSGIAQCELSGWDLLSWLRVCFKRLALQSVLLWYCTMWTIWLRSVELIACVFQDLILTVCSSLVLHNVNSLAKICWVEGMIAGMFQDLILAVCSSVVLQITCVFSLAKICWVEGMIAGMFQDLILAVCSSVVLQNTCVFSLADICWVEGMIACMFQDLILAVCSSVVLQNTCVFSLDGICWVEGLIPFMF